MTYKYEFPHYDDVLPSIDGFEDDSWHNDVSPSMRYKLFANTFVKLWCDFKDEEMREIGGKQYTVTHYSEDNFDYVPMFSSDDIEEVKKFIKQFLQLNGKV